MKSFLLLILAVSLSFFGCFEDDPNTQETFELTGSWSITDPIEQIMTFTQTTCSSNNGFKGKLISFNNSEDWYIIQLTEGVNKGEYSMTRYTLSDNGNTCTGTSYSSEDTEEAAKASTIVLYSEMILTKQ